MTSREELIEDARVAYVEAWEREDAYLTLNGHPKTSHQRSRSGIRAALDVFEKAYRVSNRDLYMATLPNEDQWEDHAPLEGPSDG